MASFTVMGIVYLVGSGTGVWGLNNPGQLGLGDRKLRILDRYRSRGDA